MLPDEKKGKCRPPLHVSPVLFIGPTLGSMSSSTNSTPSTYQSSQTPSNSPPRVIIDSPDGAPISSLSRYPRELRVEVYTDYLEENNFKKIRKPFINCSPKVRSMVYDDAVSRLLMELDPPEGEFKIANELKEIRKRRDSEDFDELFYLGVEPEKEKTAPSPDRRVLKY